MLEIADLEISYGPIRAVRGVSLVVRAREIVTLVGNNGAGKSSTLNAVAGLVQLLLGSQEVELRMWSAGEGLASRTAAEIEADAAAAYDIKKQASAEMIEHTVRTQGWYRPGCR